MQSSHYTSRASHQGYALITTLMIVAVALVVFASILSWAMSNAKVTQQNNQYNMSQNAAEAAVERVIGQVDRDFISQSISNSTGAYTTLPVTIEQSSWPVHYTYSDTNGSTGQVTVAIGPSTASVVPANSQYSNLLCYAQPVDVYATATPGGQSYNVPATVHESVQLASIPIFQFAIFYNVNLEIMSAHALDVWGPVFCNQNIWEGSTLVTFHSTVTAVGTNAPQAADPFSADYTGSGASTFLVAGQPKSKATPLIMPIGTNNSAGAVISLLQLPPAAFAMGTAAAYTAAGQSYPANEADLVVSNFVFGTNSGSLPAGTNFVVSFEDIGHQQLRQLPYDFYRLKTGGVTNYVAPGFETNIAYAGFTWITNVTFHDWREGYNGGSGPPKVVQAVQIDVGLFKTWMLSTNHNGGSDVNVTSAPQTTKSVGSQSLDSVYVYTSVPLTGTQLPAVRVTHGRQLPSSSGFSVATQFPMYVQGDYNVQTPAGSCLGLYGTNGATTYTYPSALLADAVTILSDNWNSGSSGAGSDSSTSMDTGAANTTVNAAMLEGVVQSDPTKTGNVGMNGDYSGGVENFLRLLESWSSSTLTYNGSIVVLFYSQYATNCWRQTGHYYDAPTRHWAFDLNFSNPNKLPPLTPQVKAMIRGNWYAHK